MDFEGWRRYFVANARNRPEPDWTRAVEERRPAIPMLGPSLAHFQLGESGDGATLLKSAAARPPGPGFLEAARLFVKEEQEHARLLACLVRRFDGQLITHHWTHTAFKALRHRAGLAFEMQVLLIAENLGCAYYRLLERGTRDPVLREACALILRDEEAHLRFHADHVRASGAGAAYRGRLIALSAIATQAAWIDHGGCVESLGFTRRDFAREARAGLAGFLEGLRAPLPIPAEGAPPASVRGM